MAQTDGLDLGACQFDPGFVFILNEVVVVGFAVFSHDFDGIGHRNTSSPSAPPNTWGEYNVPQPWGKYKWNL